MRFTCTALLAMLALAAAEDATVDVYFLAPYTSIADNLDEFSQQFNVMLQRTGAVSADDIVSAVPRAADDGDITVTITLASLEASVKVTEAVEGRHLSVYIDGKGYIAVMSKTIPVTEPTTVDPQEPTTEPTTTVPATTLSPGETTTHPSENGFVWLNEYTSDNENLMDCSTGGAWSGVVISRLPVGCHRFQHAMTKQDEYNYLTLEGGAVDHFGMVCDTRCTSCISQVEKFAYGSCSPTWGGSVSTTSSAGDPCIGATYLDVEENTVSIFRYSEQGCDLHSNPATKLYIRNYPPVAMDGEAACTADGMSGDYYSLTKVADENGEVYYNGKIGCSDSDCSVGCTNVDSWQEGSCNAAADGTGMKIGIATNLLDECVSADEQQEAHHDAHADGAVEMAEVKLAASSTEEPETTTTTAATTNTTAMPTNATTPVTTTKVNDEEEMNAPEHDKTHGENKQLLAVLIAAGGVLAVAFLIAGVLHTRNMRQREIEAEYEDDDALYDEYDYNGYSKYDNCEDWEDDRLVTDI